MIAAFSTTLWIAACAAWDWQARRVPNALMTLGWAAAIVFRVSWMVNGLGRPLTEAGITLLAWGLAISFWLAQAWGAADAKFVMALSLAFPDLSMLASILAANLLLGLVFQHAVRFRTQPAVTFLGAGWLAWAGAQLLLETVR